MDLNIMIIIIDNYDSFTQNLAQYIGALGFNIKIIRNDEISIINLHYINPTHIILSPGPGHPRDSNICLEIIANFANKIPILGVCLGHQSIGYMYGSKIVQLKIPVHGKTTHILHDKKDLFDHVVNPFIATRYHSLIISQLHLPSAIDITAWTKDGIIMGCRHKIDSMVRGIQFHPESLWTDEGQKIIQNFLFQEKFDT